MTIGGNNYTKTYNLTVYERWNIYVQNNCNWETVKLYQYISGDNKKSTFPGSDGDNILVAEGVKNWKKVTLDSKWTYFIINNNNNGEETNACTTGSSSGTFAAGTYWHMTYVSNSNNPKKYTLTQDNLTTPTVTIACEVISCTQIKLTGTITSYGGYGTTPGELEAYGFQKGDEDPVNPATVSGSSFTKYFTGLTAGTEYTFKAYATSIKAKGEMSQTATTRAGGNYTIHVRIPKTNSQPKIYGYTDESANGGVKEENAVFPGVNMTAEGEAGVVYRWYSYSFDPTYNNFIITDNGTTTQSDNTVSPGSEKCYWYVSTENNESGHKRLGAMADCPSLDPQLMIEETASSGLFRYFNMTGSGPYSYTIFLAAKSTYAFKPIYGGEWLGKEGINLSRASHSASSVTPNVETNLQITTDAAGYYIFTYTPGEATIDVTYPAAYTVNFGYGSGGTGVTATASASGSLVSGDYVGAGENITFTETHSPGYTFKGWYTSTDGSTSASVVSENAITSIATNADVYAQYTENMTTVALSATNGKIQYWDGDSWEDAASSVNVGVATNCSIKAVPATGYYFAGWVNTEGTDYEITGSFNNEDNNNTTLKGKGVGETTGQTLTANFVELDKIYFRNENEETGGKLWDVNKMYVYFNVGWANDGEVYGGVNNLSTNAEMNPISAESNIYWAYVPRSFTTSGNRNVAFSDKWMSGSAYPDGVWGKFHEGNGVYRTDYSKYLNMYVPEHTEKYTSNSTKYFDNGYWMKYNTVANQDAGYYLKEGNKDNQVDIFKATANNGTTLIAKYRFRNTNVHTFFIANAAGKFYKVSATITNAACTNITLVEDATPAGFTITPTAEGDYTLYIEQAGEKMKLSVVYPISAGDYRLDYTYDTNKHLYSDIIKPDNASSTSVKKSVYIDPATTGGSLKLQKCSGLDGSSNPIWTSGTDIALSNFTKGKGVYEFDMDITDGTGNSNDVASVILNNVKLYTGNYYIKTDYAPGGWVNYKQNIMNLNTINFNKAKSSTFDYYFCKWIEEGDKNVKCIIANDYNEQITDTLIGDDVLGLVDSKPRQYLAYAANVRFSYNSYTNELKRAYINGATDWQETFLRISAGDANQIRSKYTHSAFAGNDTTFKDNNNWIYQLDLEAKPGARVKVTANYRFSDANHEQYFIGQTGDYTDANTEQILGGSTDEWLGFRIIYDFKTNKLIAAYLPQDMEVTGIKPIEADIMFIRSHNGDAGQLTFTSGNKLTDVKKAYGVMEFNKTTILDDTKSEAERALYWISFPFNVKASEIFGIGEYGKQWILEYYDGEARAREGQWVDSPTRWKFVMPAMRDTLVLRKGMGYVLALDLDEMKKDAIWVNGVTSVHLYFPSADNIGDITGTLTSVTIPAHTCSITRNNRNIWDSNWNVIGVPAYWNIASFSTPATTEQPANADKILTPGAVGFYYKWNAATNEFSVETSTSTETFQTMYSYLVQFAGTINWQAKNTTPSVAARRAATAEEKDKWTLDLHIAQDGTDADHTYIEFRDDVTDAYDMNNDLVKNANGNQTIVYTLLEKAYMPDPTATTPVRMGANCLQVPAADKTVAVGLIANKAGEYTFSMPEGTDGMDVTLIDYELNRETNLSLGDYTAVLEKGTCDNRFALRINRKNTVTSLEGCNGGELRTAGAEKVMINGNLYIRQNGQSYDAQGKRVE